MKPHECKEVDYCICSMTADEPDEYCPKHGGCLELHPQCMICGRFIKKERIDEIEYTNNRV